MKQILPILLIMCLLYCCYIKKQSKETFGGKVLLKNYYAPWCGFSKRLMPVWDRLSDMHNGDQNIEIIKVNCELNPEIAKQNNIQGFPTIILYRESGEKIVYQGDRTLDGLNKFIKDNQ